MEAMGTALSTTIDAGTAARPGIAEQEFDAIVREHQRRVYRVLFVLLRNPDVADTLTQETFLRAYEKRASFRGEARIDTWLLKIAVNLARDHARNRRASFWKRLIGVDDGENPEQISQLPDPQASPEQTLVARRQLEAAWTIAAELPPQQRTIFMLRFAEEMTLPEIAQVLGLRTGSVKTHLFRAMTTVRKRLKEQQWR
jgi:RNA polymerase sigma-70 factor (ECF subfamily)